MRRFVLIDDRNGQQPYEKRWRAGSAEIVFRSFSKKHERLAVNPTMGTVYGVKPYVINDDSVLIPVGHEVVVIPRDPKADPYFR